MEFLVIIVVVVLGVVVTGSIMGMASSGRITKLEQQNKNLNERLKRLEGERDLSNRTMPKPAEQAQAPIPDPTSTIQPAAPAPIAAASSTAEKREPVPSSKPRPSKIEKTPIGPDSLKHKPKVPKRSLEEMIGGQWSVWVGGLALLVGAILLIRFSIEAGFFGPGARILMAIALGVVLLLAGEWLKRSDDKLLKGKLGEAQKALQANASIPGLLSAVGIFSLLGATYAAHSLYGLISAPVGFIGLGVISVGAMVLSLRQGPLLAAIGLLASMATPLLIQTDTPSFISLVGYLLIIGAAALALAQRTDWGWLASGVVFGWLGWAAMSVKAATHGQLMLWGVFLLIGFVVTVWQAEKSKPIEIPKGEASLQRLNLQPILALFWGAAAAVLTLTVVGTLTSKSGDYPSSAMVFAGLSLVPLFAASVLAKRQSIHLITAGVLAIGYMMLTTIQSQNFLFALGAAVAVILALREALKAEIKTGLASAGEFWPVIAIVFGLGSVAVSYMQLSIASHSTLHAIWALIYGAAFAASAIYFQSKSRSMIMTVLLTIGAALAWWLASGLAFEDLSFSLAMSLGAALSVGAVVSLRLQGARLALLGLTGIVFAHAFLVQFPDPSSLSSQPIFNALWVYLALPTAILAAAGYFLHRRKMESETMDQIFASSVIEAAALAGFALFAVFQIRHLSNGGQVYIDKIGFEELGLQVATGLCFTLAGLSKRFSGNVVLSKSAEIISYATLAIFGLGSLIGLSPLLNRGEGIDGNIVFNSLTTGMLVPTLLLALCAWRARGRRTDNYVNVLGGLALAGGMTWMTGMVRFLFNGQGIDIFNVSFGAMELWTISAIWLLAGILLLAAGVLKRERALRIASGVIIIATVLKAFLVDMAGLEGVLRALSFVGLGLVLIVIGRAYQRFWLSDSPKDEPDQIRDISEEQ